MLQKHRSWEDFISCAEYLIQTQYTQSKLLAAHGSSAGGLVLGVVANQRPHLFRAMVLRSPFLDVLTAMMQPSLPLTIHEYEEWGDPANEEVFDFMSSYSPCTNVADSYVLTKAKEETATNTSFPSTLITVGSCARVELPLQKLLLSHLSPSLPSFLPTQDWKTKEFSVGTLSTGCLKSDLCSHCMPWKMVLLDKIYFYELHERNYLSRVCVCFLLMTYFGRV